MISLKTGVDNYIFWSEIGSGFEEPGGTSPPRIPRRTPPTPLRITPETYSAYNPGNKAASYRSS